MEITVKPKENLLFNAFNVFFIINSIQIGVGLPGFQRVIFMEAKQDSWISVLIIAIAAHFVGFIMVKTLQEYESTDLYGIHHDLFGKWIGTFFSTIFILYFVFAYTVTTRAYIEIVQVWLFPELPTWLFSLFGLLVVVYGVSGGIRVVVGSAVLSVLLTSWLILMIYFPIQYAEWSSLRPIFDHSITDILKGAYKMSFSIVGFEIIYFVYPYIKEKKKTNRYLQFGLLYTNLIYLITMLLAIIYFSENQLAKTIWATLAFFKIVSFSFIERFEIIAITLWMLIIIPNALLLAWASSKGIKRIFNIKQKYGLYAILLTSFIATIFMQTRDMNNKIYNFLGIISFYIVFIYPILLYLFLLVKKKLLRKSRSKS